MRREGYRVGMCDKRYMLLVRETDGKKQLGSLKPILYH